MMCSVARNINNTVNADQRMTWSYLLMLFYLIWVSLNPTAISTGRYAVSFIQARNRYDTGACRQWACESQEVDFLNMRLPWIHDFSMMMRKLVCKDVIHKRGCNPTAVNPVDMMASDGKTPTTLQGKLNERMLHRRGHVQRLFRHMYIVILHIFWTRGRRDPSLMERWSSYRFFW
jgi:hypothetical protein